MTERGMAQVVGQADGLHQVLIRAEGAGNGTAHLGHLQRMGQAGPEIVTLVIEEHLGLVFQPPEGGGMQDSVAVSLEGGAVFGFGIKIGAAL
jgi:hypothetical protein